MTFLYNKQDGTVLGRTGTSWGKIGVFYMIFYAFLAGWFAVMLTIFYQTLDTKTSPKWIPGDGGSILKNVAMGYRPLARSNNIESTLIWYDQNDADDIDHWVNNLNETVKPYTAAGKKKAEGTKYIECPPGKTPDAEKQEVCDFSLGSLGTTCTIENKWGYFARTPCVLLKLNKMIQWIPDYYKTMEEVEKEKDMPKDLKEHIKTQQDVNGTLPEMVWVSCNGKYAPDQEEMHEIVYTPQRGFDGRFFPYTNTPGYLAPLVAVEFKEPTPNVVISVVCTAWAKNVKPVKADRFGLIDFELLLDDKTVPVAK